jgi:hypothetical protein
MKVKETIAKVREDRKQDQIAKEEEGKKKLEQKRRAQRISRYATLAALTNKDASKNAMVMHEQNPILDQIEGTTKGVIGSPRSLKEDCQLGQWSSMEWSDSKIVDENQKLNLNIVCNHDINLDIINTNDNLLYTKEMTVQEKVDHWRQRGCFEIPSDDFLCKEFVQKKIINKGPLLDNGLDKRIRVDGKISKQDGGVVLMLEQNEVRLLKQEVAAQLLEQDTQALGHEIVETRNTTIEENKIESNVSLRNPTPQHIHDGMWKKVDQSNIDIRGDQIITQHQKKQQSKHIL